ncbi:hypothetical protein PHYPSEUDO_001871 [Phytophthora pseudosyringae]|uniref:Uncharacterized protein n=1 Tax=Phytophthora pseudosyringae TaxID=221518 RepID=A0A8T1WI01_9STRA|nr:hypothetical protein PHYPSEUDO_001871 [Phytophthora pseudosyringae]
MPTTSSSSDAETVLGEDSPLSPCVWMHTGEGRRQLLEQETAVLSTALQTSAARQAGPGADSGSGLQAPRRELLLSPASQLNVLSQISELADAQPRQLAARPQSPTRQVQRAHVWAPAVETAGRRKNLARPAASAMPKAKKQKKTAAAAAQKQPARSQAERLAADMLDWETCSEGALFVLGADEEEDQWVYEDISDSDFEA